MNVSLGSQLRAYVNQRVKQGKYVSSSEYIRELIRHDAELNDFRELIHEGLQAPVVSKATPRYFAALRKQATRRK